MCQAKVDVEAHKREVEKLVAERDSSRTTAADLRQRRSQTEHELRRKELEFERLQKHLRDLLSEKVRETNPFFSPRLTARTIALLTYVPPYSQAPNMLVFGK